MVTHYAFEGVADFLVPSISLPSIRCARGTASTSPVLPSASSLPVQPSIVVIPVVFLESLFFLGAFVFFFKKKIWWSVVWRASRPGPLRFVSVLWSACGKVPHAQRHQLGHPGYSPYRDVSGGIRFLCDSLFNILRFPITMFLTMVTSTVDRYFFQCVPDFCSVLDFQGFSCAQVTSHESSALSSHQMS